MLEIVRETLAAWWPHQSPSRRRETANHVLDRLHPMVIDEAGRAAVPHGSVVMSAAGTLAGRFDEHRALLLGDERPVPWSDLTLPLLVLWGGAR